MKKSVRIKKNRGMTYVEVIVVLSIFSVMTSVVLFNYGEFQGKVDIKNLATDIALKVVEAQKSSLAGKLPPLTQQGQITLTWKPSYGVYFNLVPVSDNKSFIYFTDLNQDGILANPACGSGGECLEKITITRGNTISNLSVFYLSAPTTAVSLNNLTITFKRPSGGAIIKSNPALNSDISYVQITVVTPKLSTAKIKIYPSGRFQVN